ncbi:MAG: ketosteroid isomerase [Frankiales bacterium]|nr:ketosteroid isomerase [Frankiales bacterium]
MVTTTEHPARAMSQRSMDAVGARDKTAWLALWADNGWVEDPVGISFIDPTGLGHHGPEGRAAFWDANIGSTEAIRFDIHDSFATGDEVANVATIHITLPGGTTTRCEGVFVYRLDEEGKLLSLRAFWEMDRMMATMTQA